jgi:hypothetical protein
MDDTVAYMLVLGRPSEGMTSGGWAKMLGTHHQQHPLRGDDPGGEHCPRTCRRQCCTLRAIQSQPKFFGLISGQSIRADQFEKWLQAIDIVYAQNGPVCNNLMINQLFNPDT